MINTYYTWIHVILTCKEITWEKKGSKAIHVFGVEDKKQITIVVSFAPNGSSLPLQVTFIGSYHGCQCHKVHSFECLPTNYNKIVSNF
jgi:hypothetical protein